MAYKNKESQRQYAKEHYLKNKEEYKRRAKENNISYKERNREFIRDYKSKNPCVDCGKIYHFSAMDFDHLEDKFENISIMQNSSYSLEKLQEEMDKCEIVCANCHRVRTFNRLGDMAELVYAAHSKCVP